jgi:hypothetical protein
MGTDWLVVLSVGGIYVNATTLKMAKIASRTAITSVEIAPQKVR